MPYIVIPSSWRTKSQKYRAGSRMFKPKYFWSKKRWAKA